MALDLTKSELKKRIKIYEDSAKYWKEQARIANNEYKHAKEYLAKYKRMLKEA